VLIAACLWPIWSTAQTQPVPDASACSTTVQSAAHLNAPGLFAGADACARDGRQGDTNFLVIVGQVRALTDLTIFVPLDDANSRKAGELYTQVYYRFGGLGFEEFYRKPENVTALEARIRNTELRLTRDYDPGWSYQPSSKTDIYSAILSNDREHRIWQMRNMALDLQNDEYYEASRAFAELQRRNPVFQEGTPAYDESNRLMARMREAASHIPELPSPADTTPYARLNEQDPALAKQQVAEGFNGPTSTSTYVFRSAADVRRSWLAAALSHQALEELVAKTDFSRQVLIAFSFGERVNASGQMLISGLGYHAGSGYMISTRFGVVGDECGVKNVPSYPFVVGVTDAVPNAQAGGYDTSNFPDKCGPIVSGRPVAHD
jgi:hypothetical protein